MAGGEARPCLLRLFTAVLQDQHDEWQDGRRHFSRAVDGSRDALDGPPLLTNRLTEGLVAKFTAAVRLHRIHTTTGDFTPRTVLGAC